MTITRTPDAPLVSRINPPHLPDPRPHGYSVAGMARATGALAFISGQGGQDATGGLAPDFAAQVAQAYANLGAVLAALGADAGAVLKLTTYVVGHDMAKLGVMTEAVLAAFGPTPPAQTLVPVPALAIPGMLFEVEAVVALP